MNPTLYVPERSDGPERRADCRSGRKGGGIDTDRCVPKFDKKMNDGEEEVEERVLQ